MKSLLTHYTARAWSALAVLLLPALLMAQVNLYQWSESMGTYTPLTDADAPLVLGQPVYWPHVFRNRAWVNNPFNDPGGQLTQSGYLNPAEGPGYPIGFDFTFNGDVFDRIGISNGGWISFGKSADNLQAVWVYNWGGTQVGDPLHQPFYNPTPSYRRNRVAGFGNSDLQQVDWSSLVPPGPRSSVKVATIGTAPNRVCVVEWHDYGLNGDVTVAINLINFQIRLYEADNSVEVHFGNMDWVSTLGRYTRTQIGLGGRANQDYNGRRTVYEQPSFIYDWTNTVPMDTSNAVCTIAVAQPGMPNGSGIAPLPGTVWRWVMPECPPPAWPHTISDISFDAAYATWESTPAGEYEYLVTTENSTSGPVVATDITTDLQASLFGLEPMTQYYFFIRSICGGEDGPWSMGTPFRTIGGGVVNCDGTALDVSYCSHQNDSITWQYISGDGSQLKLEFFNGYRGQVSDESFKVWDGVPSPSNQPIYSLPVYGNPAGINLTSISGIFTIALVTYAGACEAQSWYLPFEWRVGCKNCNDPLVAFTTVEDCDNHQYYVNANVFNLGSSSSLILNNSLGLPADTVSSTGDHQTGPFPAGQSVIVVAQNPDNVMCHSDSPTLLNAPCAVQDCGPTTYTHCYADNEVGQWAYQGENGEEIGVRFIRGTVGLGDHFYTYNGLDIEELIGTEITAGYQTSMANKLFTSAPPSTDHALVMELIADNAVSCVTEDPLFGAAEEWEYIVACYDGCVQPKGTFTTACVSASQYEVLATITDLGSTGSVQITNNGGASAQTVTATGTYSVGPFNTGTPVTVELEGANILCTWTASGLVKNDCSDWEPAADCEGTLGGTALPGTPCTTDQGEDGLWNDDCMCVVPDGIAEASMGGLQLFPNPNTGRFHVEIPASMGASSHLRLMDVTGRTVALMPLQGTGLLEVDLGPLPNGLYSAVVESNTMSLTSKISIQH